ncbi:mechanosensitive ion channel family protein [Corynebacterium lubricantis]|uniref:mechanosensitive ion channel family protein n=1 Tax=Corynebacterium lubricantis TaxID=541095 RepID=UPI000368154A|nr:mechanosensitive ion channel family protein [Corynebacterium lubricantis]
MPFQYLLNAAWQWMADSGLNIAILIVLIFLVPRAGRLANRILERRIEQKGDAEEGKSQLALSGVGVYILQIIAYFILIVLILQQFGFSLAGAAIPATIVSAAVGFGAQSIIADFLSGFFILTEKQYGVGDWVAFEGTGSTGTLEGTVIQFTMRSTQIRTIDQSTVTIPNSTARVAINRSKYWSRAVVVMPVPLLGSHSSDEALERAERATRTALARPEVKSELLGDLDVHPAVAVSPPTTVGMPWTVDMRFMIQVKAGSQWLVERAIRMSILNEFWDEYGSATTVSGALIEDVHTPKLPTEAFNDNGTRDDSGTQSDVKDDKIVADTTPSATATTAAFAATTGETGKIDLSEPTDEANDEATTQIFSPGDAKTELFPATTAENSDENSEEKKSSQADSDQPDVPEKFDEGDGEDPAVTEKAKDTEKKEDPKTKFERFITLGGRMRVSSAGLLILLVALLILRGLTFSSTANDERVAGVLAPPATSTAPETAGEQPTGTTSGSQTTGTNETGQQQTDSNWTEQVSPTDQQAPTTQQDAPQQNTQNQQDSVNQFQQEPTTAQQQPQQQTQQQQQPQQQQQTQPPTVSPQSAETTVQSETTVR